MELESPFELVVLLRVTLVPLSSDVVVSRVVDPSEPFDVLDFTEDVDFFDPDEEDPDPDDVEDFGDADFVADGFDDWDFGAADLLLSADFALSADFDAEGSAAAFEPVRSAGWDAGESAVGFAADESLLDGFVASASSADSRVVVTSMADASADRVVVCVVRERSAGSARVERVVTEPVDGSTARARVVTAPVDGSVSVEELPSGDVVTRGVAAPDGAAPVVVVIPSDEPGGASVDAGPSVGIGQPSGWSPDPRFPAPLALVGASGESLPPVPGASVDPVPVAVASPGRSAVAGAAEEDGGSELLGPSIGIGQPSGATAGTATAGVCFASPPPSCFLAAPPSVPFFFGVSIFGSSTFGAAGASAFFGDPAFGSFGALAFGASAFFGAFASGTSACGASAFFGAFASGTSACGAAAVGASASPLRGRTPPSTWPGRSCTRGGAATDGLPGGGLDTPADGGTIGARGAAARGDGACAPGTIGASGGSQPDGVLDAGTGAFPRGRAPGSGIGVSGGASESSGAPGSDGAVPSAPPAAEPPPEGAGAAEVPRSAPGTLEPPPGTAPGPGP